MDETEQESPQPSRQVRRRTAKKANNQAAKVPLTDMEKAHRQFIGGMIALAVIALILMFAFHQYFDFAIE